MRWIVTGGAGFIGSAFVRRALELGWAEKITVVDALTYAGNLDNLAPVQNDPRFEFVHANICDAKAMAEVFARPPRAVFHFAAESHVDRSILSAQAFVETNVVGTQILLDAARRAGVERFVHVSTDEVYGSLPLEGAPPFVETSEISPTSPYAASKAASDHMALAAHRTHGLDVVVTRCSNNYGPYQFPEKFIPLFITQAFEGKDLPLYGDGKNVRDWIHVDDHSQGVYLAFQLGKSGEVYNLGGECERANRDIAVAICAAVGQPSSLIKPVADRLGHDRRYAMNVDKARRELGFAPGPPLEKRLLELATWYKTNRPWWERVKSGAYRETYDAIYRGQVSA